MCVESAPSVRPQAGLGAEPATQLRGGAGSRRPLRPRGTRRRVRAPGAADRALRRRLRVVCPPGLAFWLLVPVSVSIYYL